MACFYPVPAGRSTNLLAQTRLVQQLNNDQLAIQKLQNQISTGKKIAAPGDDPSAAHRREQLQPILELKAQAKTNPQAAQSYLDATDSALSNVTTLISSVRAAAVGAA